MEADLASEEGEDEFLLAGIAKAADATGLKLSDDQIYDFLTPPVLGGEYAVENLRAVRFEVALDLLGQIHEQIRDLPDGAKVRIEVEE